jgi:hypothetical protein
MLTAPKNAALLAIFKHWLAIQSHPVVTSGRQSKATLQARIGLTIHLADYFLLNAKTFQLASHGFGLVTENDIRALTWKLSGSRSTYTTIYEWPARLSAFLRSKAASLPTNELLAIILRQPLLTSEPRGGPAMTSLSEDEIIRARAALWRDGLLHSRDLSGLRADIPAIWRIVQPSVLGCERNVPVPPELTIRTAFSNARRSATRPKPADMGQRPSSKTSFSTYLSIIRSLSLLEGDGISMPPVPRKVFGDARLGVNLSECEPPGRFALPDSELVLRHLRHAIEFAIAYGDALVDAYLYLLQGWRPSDGGLTKHARFVFAHSCVTPELDSLHITGWFACPKYKLETLEEDLARQRHSLQYLMRVLVGAIQLSIGALSARRIQELYDLHAGSSLDASRTRLVFFNRKSGLGDLRQKESRPIPGIAVRMIGMLERLQLGMINLGAIKKPARLFAHPSRQGGKLSECGIVSHRNVDLFCDYVHAADGKNGSFVRIRQHQLRRFFAMLFFWGKSYGGLDTLRWFLGHADPRHLYRYITEAVPGEVLRKVKAAYAVGRIKDASAEEPLADLVEHHFGTRQFSVLDDDEVTEYIETLLEQGTVTVEPEFIHTRSGPSHRVLIHVRQGGSGGKIA